MALNIKSTEADRLARALASATGETLTQAVVTALKERLQRETGRGDRRSLQADLRRLQQQFVKGRDPDAPSADDIIGYDEHGLPS